MLSFQFNRNALLAAFILACGAAPAVAEERSTARYTLNDCLDLALRANEALQIQDERLAEAAQRVRQADADRLPVVDFRYNRFFRDTSGVSTAGDGTDSRLVVTQPLFDGFRRADTSRFARSALRREEFQRAVAARSLKGDVARAFFSVAQVESDIRNNEETLALLRERRSELAARVRLGKSRDSELLMVESQIAGIQAQQEKFKGDHAGSWTGLAWLTGINAAPSSVIYDTDAVPSLPSRSDISAEAGQRSDVRAAEEDLAAQNIRTALARGARLPTLGLDGSWYLARSGSLNGSDWELLFALNFPLYNGGGTKARVEEQSASEREYRLRLLQARRSAETELRRLSSDLAASIAQAEPYRDAWALADKSSELQRKDYRLGLVTNLDVLQSMTAVLDAKKNLDRSILQAQLNKALLDIATEKD